MRTETQRIYRERILRVLLHIQKNLDEPLALDDLADLAHFSPYHFHRVFKGMVGEGVKEHIRRLRVERAAMQLKQTDLPVTTIAFGAGYGAHAAFTRAFRAMFGDAPSGFRSNHSPLVFAASPSGVHFDPEKGPSDFNPLEEGSTMDVRIEQVKEMKVAFVRHLGPYDQCGSAWEKLTGWAAPQGLLGAGPTFIGICHDDPEVTPPDKVRYDACLTVEEDFEPGGDIGVQTIAAGEYAVTTHIGPYSKLGDTYAKLFGQWLPQNGREPAPQPGFEIYLNDPDGTEPEELLTDIYVPLA